MHFIKTRWLLISVTIIVVTVVIIWIAAATQERPSDLDKNTVGKVDQGFQWQAPDTSQISSAEERALVLYGRDLIAHTALYLGPKGKVAAVSNGMNCQNCHLDAGTRLWGNNFSAVFSTYPRFRERSGTIENIYKRVNDCMERSMNGNKLDTNSREMKAMAAYIEWVGHNVPKKITPVGAGIRNLPFLDRPADPAKGREVFMQHCQRCHGAEGGGALNADSTMYLYPPLWGENSFNTGAGLYRLSRLAGYVRDNMPFDASATVRRLTDEEAWDVAAFITSQQRPEKSFPKDWPDISGKPLDYPFGPYADSFPQQQHRFGPFGPIKVNLDKLTGMKTK